MWANYVLNALGLPPPSSSRLEHMRWWWRAHNMVGGWLGLGWQILLKDLNGTMVTLDVGSIVIWAT
jgi:hypothetical protein